MDNLKLKKPVILCVDDEKFVLDELYRQLQRRFGNQYLYELAESGQEALQTIDELTQEGHSLKMIIVDQVMPGIKGDELLATVHAKDPSSIKILLTGQASLDSAIHAINSAAIFRFITKPWDEAEFLKAVEEGLDRYDHVEIISKKKRGQLTENEILTVVYSEIQKMLPKTGEGGFEPTNPLMTLGFTSMDLLDLRNRLRDILGEDFQVTLFFQFTNPAEIAKYFIKKILHPLEESAIGVEGAERLEINSHEPIAVIGMACRFPGANNYEEFWSNLANGVDSIREIPSDRWDWKEQAAKVQWGGFIDDIDKFDPLFFNITPKEAKYIDPQHRLFLQTAWHAMEDAGYSSKQIAGKAVGVYVGVSKNDYAELMREKHEEIAPYVSTGTVHSILSNRLSFILDIHGPSESLDTACSSSLFALNNAIHDLRSGICTMAFVGGVNALISPTMFISHSRSGMLSPDGRCKTFDESANGYARGEGVGVILIKPLNDALRDGDNIHAVIRGISVNHGGKATALTAPNINAQAEVIEKALKDAIVEPESISFIEAHGTGTPLGDPIEIEGLKKAFSSIPVNNLKEGSCLVGSVKTNIGHCESASGIAGIIKLILAMKNKAIPPILHFNHLNNKIDLSNSPFKLALNYENWTPSDGKRRFGGVSSFGMGGANAHVILEEAPERESPNFPLKEQVFPISAKKGRLKEYLKLLSQYIQKNLNRSDNNFLASLAYTLQTGRDPFEERAVFSADNLHKLYEDLERYLKGERIESILSEDCQKWMNGETVDWEKNWDKKPIRLAGLPSYPFTKMRCWFEEERKEISPTPSATQKEQTFNIPADRFFLKDHIVAGKSILPGVMYLELARGFAENSHKLRGLANIQWISPLESGVDGIEASIIYEGDHLSHFRILEKDVVKCSGELLYGSQEKIFSPHSISDLVNGHPNKIVMQEIYEKMKLVGLSQGPSLRVLTELHSGAHSALGKLVLPSTVKLEEYKLHPSLMDGVYQTVVAHYFTEHKEGLQQYLPFSLKSVEWFRPLEKEVYAYVEELPDSSPNLLKYRMQMLTSSGEVIVNFDSFYRRPLHKQIALISDIYYEEQWETLPTIRNREVSNTIILFSDNENLKKEIKDIIPGQGVIYVGLGKQYQKQDDEHYILNPNNPSDFHVLMEEFKNRKLILKDIIYKFPVPDIMPVLHLTQEILKTKIYKNLLLLYLYNTSEELTNAQFAMAAGFGRTLLFENPQIELRSVEIDQHSTKTLAKLIVDEFGTQRINPILDISYTNGIRYIRKIVPAPRMERFTPKENVLKKGGVYFITGGAGGLGKIFSKFLADQVNAHLILLGRSELNPTIQKTIEWLNETATSVHYLSADVCDLPSLEKALKQLPSSLQKFDGIIHATGIKKDSFILKKTEKDFKDVIQSKVIGTLNLDLLTQKMNLDFFLLFSSIASLIPNQGQSDYAASNSFLDKFSKIRNRLVRGGLRHGFTLSINWPLWASGGMQVTSEQESHLKEEFGMVPLATEVGIQVFEHMINYAHESPEHKDQIIVLSGNKEKIRRAFEGKKEVQTSDTQDDIEKIIRETISKVIHLPENELDPDADFESYGINSIVMTELNSILEKHFKGISKTLFFEYPNLRELVAHFSHIEKKEKAPDEKKVSSVLTSSPIKEAHLPLVDEVKPGDEFSLSLKTFTPEEIFVKGFSHQGKPSVPGACFLEMARQATSVLYPEFSCPSITHNYWPVPLEIRGSSIDVQTKLTPVDGQINFEITCDHVVHATGILNTEKFVKAIPKFDLTDKIKKTHLKLTSDEFYRTIHKNADLRLAGLFRPVQELHVLEGEAIAHLVFPDTSKFDKEQIVIHPMMFTGLEQTLLVYTAITHQKFHPEGMRLMPVSIESVDIFAPFTPSAYLLITPKKTPSAENKIQRFDAYLFDEKGNTLAVVTGNTMRISPITSEKTVSVERKKWIKKEKSHGPVKCRVFCFHHAGGSAHNFKGWQEAMPEGIELNLIQLPGRGLRSDEPLSSNIHWMTHEIINEMLPDIHEPYLFFAHSMGTLLASEIAKELQMLDFALPLHLILSSNSPMYNNDEKHRELIFYKNLPDHIFLKKVAEITGGIPDSILNDPVASEILLKLLRADFTALTEIFTLEHKLKIPITTIHCYEDKYCTQDDLKRWSNVTESICEHLQLPGSHLSLLENPKPFIEIIINLVSKYL